MDNIGLLFDRFAVAYQHSLYAIKREQEKSRESVGHQENKRKSSLIRNGVVPQPSLQTV